MSRNLPPPPGGDIGAQFDEMMDDVMGGGSGLPPVPGHHVEPDYDDYSQPEGVTPPPPPVNRSQSLGSGSSLPPPPVHASSASAVPATGLPPPPGSKSVVPPPPPAGDTGEYDYDYDGGEETPGEEGEAELKEGGWCGARGVGCEGSCCYFHWNELPLCGFNPDYCPSIKNYPYVPYWNKNPEVAESFADEAEEVYDPATVDPTLLVGQPERTLLWTSQIESIIHTVTYIFNAFAFVFYLIVCAIIAATGDPFALAVIIAAPLGFVITFACLLPLEFFVRYWGLYRIYALMKQETADGTGKTCKRTCWWVLYAMATAVSIFLHFNALVGFAGGVGVFSLANCLLRAAGQGFFYFVAFLASVSTLLWMLSTGVTVVLAIMLVLRCIRSNAETVERGGEDGLAKDASIVAAMVPWAVGGGDGGGEEQV